MLKSAVILALLAVGMARQDSKIVLFGPKGATEETLQRAAKALIARCEASGIKGPAFAVGKTSGSREKSVTLTCPADFTDSMKDTLLYYASFACARIELRFIHWMKQKEADKFAPGESAPRGSSWVRTRCWTRSEGDSRVLLKPDAETLLLKDAPIVDVAGKFSIVKHEGGPYQGQKMDAGVYLEFAPDVTRTLRDSIIKHPDDPTRTILPVVLFIDGAKVPSESGMMNWSSRVEKDPGNPVQRAVWKLEYISDATVLPLLMKHPMACPLQTNE